MSLSESFTMPILDEYQTRFVNSVAALLGSNYYSRRPKIRILDSGCDTSGRQLWHLKQMTRGEVVGVNPEPGFPSPAAINTAGERTRLISMDGMNLGFPDESFDVVLSANVIEHVPDVCRFLCECSRVLKPNGVAYIESAPIWTSPRGHHIMDCMVSVDCPEERRYRDDGSVIPDWSHLKLTESEMAQMLGDNGLQSKTIDYITSIIYRSTVLNKTPWSLIQTSLRTAFPIAKINRWPIEVSDRSYCPVDANEEYDVQGFSFIGRKREQNAVARRLCWRLRKLGI